MDRVVIFIHGKGGNAGETEHYKGIFKDCEVIGFDYAATTPWEAQTEFSSFYDAISTKYESVIVIANSIGAFFTMNSLFNRKIEQAFFISPIVNMEKLITDMMMWAGVTEKDLCDKKEIATSFGETLSWEYFCYVKEHPVTWTVPTHILYGDTDHLTTYETIADFSKQIGATLTVMKNGEHWFHTEKQMEFLDRWIEQYVMNFSIKEK